MMVVPLGHPPTWIPLVVGCRFVPGHSGVIKRSVAAESAAASTIGGVVVAPSNPQLASYIHRKRYKFTHCTQFYNCTRGRSNLFKY